ncbi:uncharacterized protein LOC107037978 [Diachasma alloeum]|uniref:uncharacterized protein LOC107037978 n=1 Tax=Diachasma alloeum TaxID=454923 RepID=UPI00073842B3|nr:uncharacterized protein LOC107037978 [Diachasma alloeum]
MAEDSGAVELEELREAARISSIYQAEIRKFHRNASISTIVHGLLHLSEFASVTAVELFHHIHHAVNRILREENPDVPHIPEERNLLFFGLPISMTISLLLSIMWFFFHTLKWKLQVATSGCALGGTLMLLSGIFSMRHAEVHINVEEVSDEELLLHPIFIHNFVICVLSIFALMLYLIHFWILYDCLRWERKYGGDDSSRVSTETSGESSSSYHGKSSSEKSGGSGQLTPIPTWDGLHVRRRAAEFINVQDEPVTLYCCCLDLWHYLRHDKTRLRPTNEFQVVHVL